MTHPTATLKIPFQTPIEAIAQLDRDERHQLWQLLAAELSALFSQPFKVSGLKGRDRPANA